MTLLTFIIAFPIYIAAGILDAISILLFRIADAIHDPFRPLPQSNPTVAKPEDIS